MADPTPPDERRRRAALEDEWLAVRCQLGESDAFDTLIARWHQPLWKFVRHLTDDDETAAETVQEVWLRVCRGIGRLRDPERFRAWMFGIARRVVVDRLRRKYAEPQMSEVDVADVPGADDAEWRARVRELHEEIAKLPIVEREALVLFYLEELTLAELAEVWSVPVGTVKSRLHRARRVLGEQLREKGETA